ncbi:MAG: hypothetical protein JWN86_439 [Planctomycetota bacterium]|nr:hypothetical protein [Planctomycetota bacterium]
MGNVLVRLKMIEKASLARVPTIIDVTADDVRDVESHAGRSVSAKLCELLAATTSDGRTVATLVAEVILSKALGGDFRFMTELLNRTEGKVTDQVKEPASPTILHWEDEHAITLVYGHETGQLGAVTTETPTDPPPRHRP